ncbi:Na/Pi symporter [Bacteriovoracaceae bacterium]|nr:Na/Pi symporter [Bacteriovoracaceae bacterium]
MKVITDAFKHYLLSWKFQKRLLLVLSLLLLFLIGISILSSGFKLLGGGFAKTLFNITSDPFISLMAGMLATVLFQSSSVTTSIIVGLVSAGTLPMGGAIPMIMGANLGTSVTNTLVSIGYINNTNNFKKAFAAATVHDFFNILAVAILLPLEIMTGIIEKMATSFSSALYGSMAGVKFSSPIKALIKPPVKFIKTLSVETFGADIAGIGMIILAGIVILVSLSMIVKTMKVVVESNKGEIINNALSKNGYASILFGMLITVIAQSSSITTSLLIPLAGTGVLSLAAIYPITIGANIGTTATALLAALTGNVAGLSIALVHLIFNLLATAIFYPNPTLRKIPVYLAEKLAESIERTKMIGFGYVGGVFFALPLVMIYISR